MRFEFGHSHAYPGCLLRIPEDADGLRGQEDIVEFSDGAVADARHQARDGAIVLHVAPYRTARGTAIEAKTWLLEPDGEPGRWRVRRRLSAA